MSRNFPLLLLLRLAALTSIKIAFFLFAILIPVAHYVFCSKVGVAVAGPRRMLALTIGVALLLAALMSLLSRLFGSAPEEHPAEDVPLHPEQGAPPPQFFGPGGKPVRCEHFGALAAILDFHF